MSSGVDWVGREASITEKLVQATDARGRERLLACLTDYSKAVVAEARRFGGTVPSQAECSRTLEWLLRPVFICGHHRSGTTLLQSLLDDHPEVLTIPNEGTYFTSFAYVAGGTQSEADMDRFAAEWVMRFVDPNYEPHFRLGLSDASACPAVAFARALFGWCQALRPHIPDELAPLVALAAAFKDVTAPSKTPRCWVEKTPQNERFAGRLLAFRAARCIQMIRDPAATLTSLAAAYRHSGSGEYDAARSARAIGRSLRLARRNSSRLQNSYCLVRYEDLVAKPVDEMRRVQRFLEIGWDESLLQPTAGGRSVRANSSFGPRDAGVIHADVHRAPPSVRERDLLGVYCGIEARHFGYQIALPGMSRRMAYRLRDWPVALFRSGCNRVRNRMLRSSARSR